MKKPRIVNLPDEELVSNDKTELKYIFKDEPIGEFVLDNVANRCVILEYKAVSEIAKIHKQQALSYLKATGLELAIVINFGAERVQSSRVVYKKGKANFLSRVPRLHSPLEND